MKRGLAALALLVATGLAAEEPPQAPVQVVARPTTAEPALAAPFVVEVEISGPPGSRFTVPRAGGDDAVELVLEDPGSSGSAAGVNPSAVPRGLRRNSSSAPAPPPGPADTPLEIAGPRATLRYRAQAFAVDEAALPPILVRYRLADGSTGEATSAAVPLRIASLLPKDPQQRTLADIKGPVPLVVAPAFWWALGVAMTLVALALAWLWRRRRRAGVEAMTPAVPPVAADVEALAALDRLAPLAEASQHHPFYVGLAAVVKRYLERRLGAPVLEMTSAETVAFLRGHAHGEPLFGPVRELVTAADQVKFARAGSLRAEAQRHLDAARHVVAGLEARLAPPPGAKAEGA